MFKFLGKQKTSKADIIMALAAVAVAIYKAIDTVKDYKSDQIKEINS